MDSKVALQLLLQQQYMWDGKHFHVLLVSRILLRLPENAEERNVEAPICGQERRGLQDLRKQPFLVIIFFPPP